MIPSQHAGGSYADLHCHSTASEVAKLGIQRSIGLPECATPPQEVYELAKSRGMDFVTITDHDTIDGCLELADRPDCFISEELTAWFADEPQAVHVLCYGITPDDHEFLQGQARDLETCAEYLREREITCALAHPFFAVGAPLTGRHRRRLAELFDVWETRNGSRARALNMPAAVYIDTHGGTGIGGSDDHAGVDIGRTYTETPPAASPQEYLRHVREGRARCHGDEGSAAKWAHAALALAIRTLGKSDEPAAMPDPRAVFEIAERVVSDGAERGGSPAAELGAKEARAVLQAWLASVGLSPDPERLIATMQAEGFSHGGLARRARRAHERALRGAIGDLTDAVRDGGDYGAAATSLFEACVPAIPYVPAATILGAEIAKLSGSNGDPGRVAVIADGTGSVHGVTHTIERIREHGVSRWEVDVIGTDGAVDRRLPSVAELDVPFYSGLAVGVPSVPALVETLAEGRYDLVHVTAPGPAGIGAALAARIAGIPLIGSYHTEFGAYARLRSGDPRVELAVGAAVSAFYRQCELVLSPSPASDASLAVLGIEAGRVRRWVRGVDTDLYDSARARPHGVPGRVNVLYAGRLTREKGVDLLAESFLLARRRDPRLHLVVAGEGPEEPALRARLGEQATFAGCLGREQLADAYASADLFLFCSRTDTYGQVIREAQASGLAVVAVGEGGPASLIRNRHTGWLCEPTAEAIAAAVAQLAASPFLRLRMGRAARAAVRDCGWDAALDQLAARYGEALGLTARKVEPAGTLEAA